MRALGQNRKVCIYLPVGRQVYEVAKSYGFSFGQEKKTTPASPAGRQ